MHNVHSLTRRGFVQTVGATGAAVWAHTAGLAQESHPVTLALLGAAHMHTPLFLQMLQMREEVRIAHVFDRDPARAQKHAAECGAQVAKTAADVLGDSRVAGVLVLSETRLHAELAVAAARAGKHVFVEKPLGVNAADASEIAAAVQRAGVLFHTGYHLRSASRNIFVRQHIQQGSFGRIVRVQASFCNDCVLQGEFDNELKWSTDLQWGALGGFADTATHALDLLMWLIGDVESVAADTRSLTNRYPDCDEIGQGLLRFTNGATGTISGSWIEPENPVSLLVSGTEGHAVVLNDRLYVRSKKIEGADGARPWMKLAPPPDHPLLQFVSAVAGQRDVPLVTVREAAARVQVMEALYQSARQRKWVTVG
ncbi:MAG: Gfo/Idh/MocA family oxidoreductase [Candidatus Anammoximicrobium sp.]|nr:Gfo/Idh/MocA family oxidoreductase [Candidatus Anammoximicrobium sp.]